MISLSRKEIFANNYQQLSSYQTRYPSHGGLQPCQPSIRINLARRLPHHAIRTLPRLPPSRPNISISRATTLGHRNRPQPTRKSIPRHARRHRFPHPPNLQQNPRQRSHLPRLPPLVQIRRVRTALRILRRVHPTGATDIDGDECQATRRAGSLGHM